MTPAIAAEEAAQTSAWKHDPPKREFFRFGWEDGYLGRDTAPVPQWAKDAYTDGYRSGDFYRSIEGMDDFDLDYERARQRGWHD